jgi:hypothetical protein
MGFAAATGEPVMCVIIFIPESSIGIPTSWVTDINITKIDSTIEMTEDLETLVNNIKVIGTGGPKCKFKNK